MESWGRVRRGIPTYTTSEVESLIFLLSYSRVTPFPCTLQYLTSIAVQLLKQGSVNDQVLQMKGLNGFMTHLLPNIEWAEQYFPSFSNVLSRVLKLFKYLQRANVSTHFSFDSSPWQHLFIFPESVDIMGQLEWILSWWVLHSNNGEELDLSRAHTPSHCKWEYIIVVDGISGCGQ